MQKWIIFYKNLNLHLLKIILIMNNLNNTELEWDLIRHI